MPFLIGHPSSARKRRRVSENVDIEDRLESLITRVGEKVKFLLTLRHYRQFGDFGHCHFNPDLDTVISTLICHFKN